MSTHCHLVPFNFCSWKPFITNVRIYESLPQQQILYPNHNRNLKIMTLKEGKVILEFSDFWSESPKQQINTDIKNTVSRFRMHGALPTYFLYVFMAHSSGTRTIYLTLLIQWKPPAWWTSPVNKSAQSVASLWGDAGAVTKVVLTSRRGSSWKVYSRRNLGNVP